MPMYLEAAVAEGKGEDDVAKSTALQADAAGLTPSSFIRGVGLGLRLNTHTCMH